MKPRRLTYFYLIATAIVLAAACRKYKTLPDNEQDPRLSGGSQTAFDEGAGAYDHSFTGLSPYDQLIHNIGDKQFGLAFVTAPAPVNPGIGPLFNNISCESCHQSLGSGSPPQGAQTLSSFFLRLSVSGTDSHGGPAEVPGYGQQLQNNGTYGKQKEGDYSVSYATQTFTFADGETVQLKSPTYTIYNTYAAWPGGVMVSPRMAPAVFGMGLLESVGEATILENVYSNSSDTFGISGKANYVWDFTKNKMSIGRFGRKCESPNLPQQIGLALNEDIGITNKIFSNENCYGQSQYSDDGLRPEMSDSTFNALVYYMRTIAVPARRNVTNPEVQHGEQLFRQAGCIGCHKQTLVTDVNVAFPQLSNQIIHPYTDLLLHDLGMGLADNRPVYNASGREYRTCPLWGIGLTQIVTGQTSFLHDGRASTLQEAILWHGGEAFFARNFFINLSKSDRQALLAFLNSL